MKKLFAKLIIVYFVLGIVLSIGDLSVSADVGQTKVSEYALSWKDNKNIPYVWGGGRNANDTLERLASIEPITSHPTGSCTKKNRCSDCLKTGTDCSGFVRLVYQHFGIKVPSQSSAIREAAKNEFTDISKAVPGDVVWWKGHVAIYIGDEKIIHTSKTDPPNNYPHVTSVWCRDEKPKFLRMVNSVEDLKPLSGESSSSVETKVKSAKIVTDVVIESDLTGMVITDTLLKDQNELPDVTELSDEEKRVLEEIKSDIDNRDMSVLDFTRVCIVFIGIVIITYGILLPVAYLFDRTNNIIEISLLRILTLGKYRLWDINIGVKPGFNKAEGILYCDSKTMLKRAVVLEIVGFLLVGGISRFL